MRELREQQVEQDVPSGIREQFRVEKSLPEAPRPNYRAYCFSGYCRQLAVLERLLGLLRAGWLNRKTGERIGNPADFFAELQQALRVEIA